MTKHNTPPPSKKIPVDPKLHQTVRANDDDHHHTHPPLDMKALLTRLAAHEDAPFSKDEINKMASAHEPDMFLIACIDSRIQPARALDVGPGVALEYRPIGCVIPPAADAGEDLDSRMAFRRINDIKNIVLICHSDCGGAKAAIRVPEPDKSTGDDLHIVASHMRRAGADIPKLSKEFMAAENGDIDRAGNRLAKEVGIKSYENLLGYKGHNGHKTIKDEMEKGGLTVTLLYYDLAQQSFEVYSARTKSWKPLAPGANQAPLPQKKRAGDKPKGPQG
ncbi:MAG TPA: carbonic anhydrase [Alphaproteobacteria bacterium]|nr:carbonic anhydrase [Alphaproteobacteria bacterium]